MDLLGKNFNVIKKVLREPMGFFKIHFHPLGERYRFENVLNYKLLQRFEELCKEREKMMEL